MENPLSSLEISWNLNWWDLMPIESSSCTKCALVAISILILHSCILKWFERDGIMKKANDIIDLFFFCWFSIWYFSISIRFQLLSSFIVKSLELCLIFQLLIVLFPTMNEEFKKKTLKAFQIKAIVKFITSCTSLIRLPVLKMMRPKNIKFQSYETLS